MEKITEELRNLIIDYIKVKREEEILMQQIKKRTEKRHEQLTELICQIRKENKAEIAQRKSVKSKEIAKRKKELEEKIIEE